MDVVVVGRRLLAMELGGDLLGDHVDADILPPARDQGRQFGRIGILGSIFPKNGQRFAVGT